MGGGGAGGNGVAVGVGVGVMAWQSASDWELRWGLTKVLGLATG